MLQKVGWGFRQFRRTARQLYVNWIILRPPSIEIVVAFGFLALPVIFLPMYTTQEMLVSVVRCHAARRRKRGSAVPISPFLLSKVTNEWIVSGEAKKGGGIEPCSQMVIHSYPRKSCWTDLAVHTSTRPKSIWSSLFVESDLEFDLAALLRPAPRRRRRRARSRSSTHSLPPICVTFIVVSLSVPLLCKYAEMSLSLVLLPSFQSPSLPLFLVPSLTGSLPVAANAMPPRRLPPSVPPASCDGRGPPTRH